MLRHSAQRLLGWKYTKSILLMEAMEAGVTVVGAEVVGFFEGVEDGMGVVVAEVPHPTTKARVNNSRILS